MQPKKIDCHTHIVTREISREYFSRTDGWALVMQFLPRFCGGGVQDDSLATVQADERLFLCPAIDISAPIPPQLRDIEALLPCGRVVGLKIFLTYQTGRADDEKMLCIYEFARRHRLTVTFHTGSCSLVLPTENDMEGSRARYIANAAERFPDVNFVAAHMDDPRFDECMRIVDEHDNIYTDFSGAYEPGTHEGADMEWAIETFAAAMRPYPGVYRKVLYGTDFCPPINLTAIGEYDTTIARIFPREQHADIYLNNALRAFPRLADRVG